MKKSLFSSAILCALLLAVSPASAVIRVALENPGDAQDVSGIGLVSGWAFAENRQPVTVKPRIDGRTQDIVIPCCGPRQDVVNANPGAPLNTGFGALINYGDLSVGAHQIGVEVSAAGETPKVVDHSVMIAKPGNASFVTSFSLVDANVAIDGNEIVIAGAQVGSSSGTAKTNLRVNHATSSQSLVIGEAFNENTTLFNPVQSIFDAKCALSGCHASPNPQEGQDLSSGQSFKNIVAVRSRQVPSLLRVNPGRPVEESYLYRKITGENIAPNTVRMPKDAPPLSSTDISAIRNWILAGAPPPSGSGSGGGGGGGGGY